MLLILLLFLPIVTFAQLKITIPRYSIVYTFTNTLNVNEVYFDHQNKNYHTNTLSNLQHSSIKYYTNIYTFFYQDHVNYQSTIPRYHSNDKTKGWIRPSKSSYRYYTLKRTYLSNTTIPFLTNKNGTVISGLWYDHFTASYITNTKQIQIDHIVPFKEAFRSQQHNWSKEEIFNFYNSTLESALLPVYSNENQIKGDATPKNYIPPNLKFQSIYIDLWKQIKQEYNLYISSNEIQNKNQLTY